MKRYDLGVWFVLRGSMGRQESSDSQALSQETFFCGVLCFLAVSAPQSVPSPPTSLFLFAPARPSALLLGTGAAWGKRFH